MTFSLKRIFVIFGLALSLLVVAPPAPVHAQNVFEWGIDAANALADLYRLSGNCATDLRCWIRNAMMASGDAILKTLAGVDSQELTGAAAQPPGGLLAAVGIFSDQLYNLPPDVHLASYARYELGDSLLSPSPAYATVGTELLDPVFRFWSLMKDVANSLFVLVVAAIAIMILLQRQLAARTVVTATQAIPRMFIALIFINLSYVIAALFVDIFMVWLPQVAKTVLDTINPLAQLYAPPSGEGAIGVFGNFAQAIIASALRLGALSQASMGVGPLALLIIILIFLIVAICVLGFVCLQLIYRYGMILILTVFAPLALLLGGIPGQEGAITNWLKALATQVLTFPAILIVAYLSGTLLVSALTSTTIFLPEGLGVVGDLMFTYEPLILGMVALMLLIGTFRIPGLIAKALGGRGL